MLKMVRSRIKVQRRRIRSIRLGLMTRPIDPQLDIALSQTNKKDPESLERNQRRNFIIRTKAKARG